MNYDLKEVAFRLKSMRECIDLSAEYMAEKNNITVDEYLELENGQRDFSLSFLNKCAEILKLDLIELLTGTAPKLQKYSVVKKGKGLPIERRMGFSYHHLAYLFKNKNIEPLLVTAPFNSEEQNAPIRLSSHEGQEMNYIISGALKFVVDGHTEILEAGDCVYYDSKNPHGMIAINGKDCEFLAILI